MLLCPWKLPGRNTEAGCHLLLQGIFLTQELSLSPTSPVSPAMQADSCPAAPSEKQDIIQYYFMLFPTQNAPVWATGNYFCLSLHPFDKLAALRNYCFLFSHFLAHNKSFGFILSLYYPISPRGLLSNTGE